MKLEYVSSENKYKNIEEGHADEMIRFRNESEARIRNMTTDFLAEAVLEKLSSSVISRGPAL